MRRALVVLAGIVVLATACSGDNSAPVVEPTSAGGGAATSAAGGNSTTTAAGSSTSTASDSRAVDGLLTVEDLPPGWKAGAPSVGNDESSSEFDTPECAALAALDNQPGLDDNASVDLTSPDDGTSVTESLLVASAADAQKAYDTAAAPTTAQCLTALFTIVFNEPTQLPQGSKLDHVDIHPVARHAGDEATGFEGLIVVTTAGATVEVPVRFDVVRAGGAVGLLLFAAEPGAEAVDADGMLTTAATKMATVG
jgi:hypothetical protein